MTFEHDLMVVCSSYHISLSGKTSKPIPLFLTIKEKQKEGIPDTATSLLYCYPSGSGSDSSNTHKPDPHQTVVCTCAVVEGETMVYEGPRLEVFLTYRSLMELNSMWMNHWFFVGTSNKKKKLLLIKMSIHINNVCFFSEG